MNISIDRQRVGFVVTGGLFISCGALALKAVWKGEFQGARLPAAGMAIALLFWKILTLPSLTPSPPSPIYSRGGVQFYRTSFQGPLSAKKGEQEVALVPALFEALSAPKGEASLPYDFFKALSPQEAKDLVDLAIEQKRIVVWEPELSIQLLSCSPDLPIEVQHSLLERYRSNSYALGQFLTLFPKMLGERSSKSSLIQLACSRQGVWRVKGLVEQMRAGGISFSPEERWVAIAAEDDSLSFTDSDFLSLPEEQREQIFYFANGLEARKLLERLKALGMGVSRFQYWIPLSYFAYDMDLIQAEETLLRNLQGKRCFSRADFEQLPDRVQYLQMKPNLLQILTADGLKEVARQRGFDRILFPEYCLVVNCLERIKINIYSLDCASGYPLTICAEKRDKVKRKLTLEEAVQLMTLIWHTNEDKQTFFPTSNGVYFEPTGSLRSREGTTLEELQSCAEWVAEEDRAALLAAAKRIAAEPKEIDIQRRAIGEECRANPYRHPLAMIDEIEVDLKKLAI